MRTFTSVDGKNNFGELVDAARAAPVSIVKYDRPFVVVMTVEEQDQLAGRVAESRSTSKPASHAKLPLKKGAV